MLKKIFALSLGLIIILTLSACSGGRNTSNVESSIYGHWVEKPDNPELKDTHYYISKDKFIMVDQGTKRVSNYEITESNEKENWIKLSVKGQNNIGTLTRKLEFSDKERNKLTEILDGNSMNVSSDSANSAENQAVADVVSQILGNQPLKSEWKYVDDLTEPK